jgi:hypothetical protein
MRQQLAKAAVDYVRNNHYVDIVGPKFRDAIEFFVKHGPRVNRLHVVDQLSSRAGIPSSVGEWQEVAVALGANEKNTILGVKRLYVELPSEYRELGTIKHGEENIIQVLKQSVNELIPGWRIEPVIAISIDIYQTASRLMLQVLGCDGELVEPVCIRRCDIEYVVQWPNEVSDWLDIKRWIQSREI